MATGSYSLILNLCVCVFPFLQLISNQFHALCINLNHSYYHKSEIRWCDYHCCCVTFTLLFYCHYNFSLKAYYNCCIFVYFGEFKKTFEGCRQRTNSYSLSSPKLESLLSFLWQGDAGPTQTACTASILETYLLKRVSPRYLYFATFLRLRKPDYKRLRQSIRYIQLFSFWITFLSTGCWR